MKIAELDKIKLHYRIDGNPDGKPVLFANSLGTDLRLWDAVLPLLPQDIVTSAMINAGTGCPNVRPRPIPGNAGARWEQLMDLNVKDALFVACPLAG